MWRTNLVSRGEKFTLKKYYLICIPWESNINKYHHGRIYIYIYIYHKINTNTFQLQNAMLNILKPEPENAFMCQWVVSPLVQVMACGLIGTKASPELYWNIVNWTIGTKFSEIWIKVQQFSFEKTDFKMQSAKWQPVCSHLNVLNWFPRKRDSLASLHFQFRCSYKFGTLQITVDRGV